MGVKLVWVTPEAEKHIMYCARVSNPENQESKNTGLLRYCYNHGHWSIFEMASMCVEITTSRAIAAQIIRHRSFSFQEFSQRYAEATNVTVSKARRQDIKNRQNSIDDLDVDTLRWWDEVQETVQEISIVLYMQALEKGIAKECARMLLPMATETKLYMAGTLRSWMHYIKLRTDPATQLEHREVAEDIKVLFKEQFSNLGGLI